MKPIAFILALSMVAASGAAVAKMPRPVTKVRPASRVEPVTRSQLIDAGANCSGTACTFNGATWDCSNPSDCHTVKTN